MTNSDVTRHEEESLDRGLCPWSGLVLHRNGEAGPDRASCDVCDCFGYPTTVLEESGGATRSGQ